MYKYQPIVSTPSRIRLISQILWHITVALTIIKCKILTIEKLLLRLLFVKPYGALTRAIQCCWKASGGKLLWDYDLRAMGL